MERNERAVRNLTAAINTMRNACEAAEQAVERGTDEDAARRVLHEFAWGFANASGCIESAMSALEDDRIMRRMRESNSDVPNAIVSGLPHKGDK